MAEVNTKFIANPSFMIQNVGRQTITVGWRPRYVIITEEDKTADPPVDEKGAYRGFCDLPLGGFFSYVAGFDSDLLSPLSVSMSPEFELRISSRMGRGAKKESSKMGINGLYTFLQFLSSNPIHLSKINVRTNDAAYLPSVLEILTPNIFSGQYDRQVVNIVADTNMYQNQSNIVTLDCDVFITRNSILRVDSAFDVDPAASTPSLNMDMTFDKYLSLEKALVENYELLQTEAGIANAVEQEVANINAKMPAVQVAAQPIQVAAQPFQILASPWTNSQNLMGSKTASNRGNR